MMALRRAGGGKPIGQGPIAKAFAVAIVVVPVTIVLMGGLIVWGITKNADKIGQGIVAFTPAGAAANVLRS